MGESLTHCAHSLSHAVIQLSMPKLSASLGSLVYLEGNGYELLQLQNGFLNMNANTKMLSIPQQPARWDCSTTHHPKHCSPPRTLH